ncbi:hypothetical protein AYO49_05455 [Verrucomicrobiaceae bacterium SCGC AG-212-N21]|nr:hypothetical protein AYO49_05455 [Verrucomicrobiaceae bacterium SCGC AG-212-N21]
MSTTELIAAWVFECLHFTLMLSGVLFWALVIRAAVESFRARRRARGVVAVIRDQVAVGDE